VLVLFATILIAERSFSDTGNLEFPHDDKRTYQALAQDFKKLRQSGWTIGWSRRHSNAYIASQNRTDMGHFVQSCCLCTEDWVHARWHWVSRAA
jgi:hypothetical protein